MNSDRKITPRGLIGWKIGEWDSYSTVILIKECNNVISAIYLAIYLLP
jgi:hypothetical protein